ncbi:MAG: selenide, water dikinase SelD [Actinomycetota bacterium]|nr:selenide, water dikinase SelD [Actinomycetota bacterium]
MPVDGPPPVRLTRYATGGGCACKIPPDVLERVLARLPVMTGHGGEVLVGMDSGDDAGVVRVSEDVAVISTADFFTPVVDDAYDFGRVAAANALSDVYAMGGRPVMAVNLVGWPGDVLGEDVLAEVLRGGAEVAARAGCPVLGGHSIQSPEPTFGMGVTGVAHPDRLLRNDAARAGLPLTLTKPLGSGVLNNWHRRTGGHSPEALEAMTTLNDAASAAAVAAGLTAATDVTGFGLLGHLHKMMRASGTTARLDVTAVPLLARAREVAAVGFVSGGTRRNLDWVRPHLSVGGVGELDLLLLADAQTSGGLLLVGEVDLPGAVVIGEVLPAQGPTLVLR